MTRHIVDYAYQPKPQPQVSSTKQIVKFCLVALAIILAVGLICNATGTLDWVFGSMTEIGGLFFA